MSHPLDPWCRGLVDKYGHPTAISPKQLAQEFVESFGVSVDPTLNCLVSLARDFGLAAVEHVDLPKGMPGHHYESGGRYYIELDAEQWSGRSMFTICHEFEEMIQERFEAVVSSYRAVRREDAPTCRGRPANRFAACVLMQETVFCDALLSRGLDIIGLRHDFNQSYMAVAIRAIEVLNDSGPDGLDAVVTIYETPPSGSQCQQQGALEESPFEVTWVRRTHGFKVGRRGGRPLPRGGWQSANYMAPRYPGHLIPLVGDNVNPGSLAQHVISTGRPALRHRVYGFDLFGFNDLTALARPVRWYGQLAKVVLVAVPTTRADVLQAQVSAISVDELGESFQQI